MNNVGGFITLHRQIQNWEWYKNVNTAFLFIHLILSANFVDTKFEGKTIKRGQLVTSLQSLTNETGMSVREVRTALKHLISTGEVTNESTRQYRIITVVKYEDYQTETNKVTNKRQTKDKQTTNERQTSDKQTTNERQYHNNNNKGTMEQGNKGTRETIKREEPRARFTPPTADQVREYCEERGNGINPEDFVNFYEARGWELGHGTKMKDWKAAVRTWERRETKRPGKIVTENPFLRMLREREEAKEE